MKTKLMGLLLLGGTAMFAQAGVSFGVGVGGFGAAAYVAAPPAYATIPPCPGPDYIWVDGYWSQNYGRNAWVNGYWEHRPFVSGFQVAPRFDNRFVDRDDRGRNTRDFDRGPAARNVPSHSFDQNQSRSRSTAQDNRQGHSNGSRGR